MRRVALILLLWVWAAAAHAHKPSDSYLGLSVEGNRIAGQWDIALRDLDFAVGLDADGNGVVASRRAGRRVAPGRARSFPDRASPSVVNPHPYCPLPDALSPMLGSICL